VEEERGDPHSGDYPAPQTSSVTLTFSRPVTQLALRAYGAANCAGLFPNVVAKDSVGNVIYTGALADEFSDCGADQISGFLMDSVEVTTPIKSLVVGPPSPWTWIHADLTAYAKLFYTV